MRKIRYYCVVLTLFASLSGFSFLGLGTLPNMAASHQSSAISVASAVGKASGFVAFIPRGICPSDGSDDC